MRLHKTGHVIADTVSDLIGELPDGDYKAAYGILRHSIFHDRHWFEIDKGFWNSEHYTGNYRLSYRGTQPEFTRNAPQEPHGLTLEPWRDNDGPILICPPTDHVCRFFGVNLPTWIWNVVAQCDGLSYGIRYKGDPTPINWGAISKVITFNSTIGFEALRRGIPVESDPVHSTIGSYTSAINSIDKYDRSQLFRFCGAHQFKLGEKDKICRLIKYYLSISDGTQERQ